MANLFLSYSRKDASRARRFCEWLEREGHDVWRDEDDIGGGASFSSEIEKALQACDAVLVLWSAYSVQSAWVRDEAAYGRDGGKLIPLSLDETEPPLGFRQFQAIRLSSWKGRGEPPNADRITNAIGRLAKGPQSPPATPLSAPASRRTRRAGAAMLAAGIIAVALAALLAFLLWQRWSGGGDIVIAVGPSPQSSDRTMAADYANVAAADMAAFLPRRFDRATVIAPADTGESASGYKMLISTDPRGAGANATITLSDQDGRTTLWSENWSVADAAGADLKAQVSAAASKAALCLTDARGGRARLTQPALGLYLSGCTGLGESQLSNEDFVRIFERVTKLAPDFAPGWGYLGLSRSWIAEGLRGSSSPAYAAALQSARDAIARARKLNPDSALAYDAEFHLSNDTFRGLQILEKGAQVDPEYGMIQMHLSDELRTVGRMADSVEAAQNAVELEPGSPYTRYQYILALVYSGQFSNAKSEIASARKRWPNDVAVDLADFSFQYRYGDPRAALQLLPRVARSSDAEMAPYTKVIEARLDPTPAKIDDAIAALKEVKDPSGRNDLLLALGNFGRIDDVYQLLEDRPFQPFLNSSALFEPDFAAVRADPRFMRVAARLGLVRYWRQTGYWPDFCASEKLPYDCKTEAAKYAGRGAASTTR
jgi:hypothetical protein